MSLSRSSLRHLRSVFDRASAPAIDRIPGYYEAELAGPFWLRAAGRPLMMATGMPRWWGKSFAQASAANGSFPGVNLVKLSTGLRESITITASIGPSRLDGRDALIVKYPSRAPMPWRWVTDELRYVDNDQWIGLTFGIPLSPPGGAPFLLRRSASPPTVL